MLGRVGTALEMIKVVVRRIQSALRALNDFGRIETMRFRHPWLRKGLGKLPGPVHNGGNFDQFPAHPIDNSIIFEDELAKVIPPVLWDHPARLWEFAQLLYVGHDALDKEACVVS